MQTANVTRKIFAESDDILSIRIDRKKALFHEIELHLLNDSTPSAYFTTIRKKEELQAHPFDMLVRLQRTNQPPAHHPEGSVWNHTLLVVDEAARVKGGSRDARAFMWAALLHDIGKPDATKVRKGKITAYGHDRLGAELAQQLLSEFTDDGIFIRSVSQLIGYHMHILYIEKNLPFADIKGLREQTDVREVALLGLCDRLGRLGSNREKEEANIRSFLQQATAASKQS